MKTVIYYDSKLGTTKKYAKWLGEEVKATVNTYKQYSEEEIGKVDTIVVMSGTYAAQMPLIKFLKKHWNQIQKKKVVVVAVGAAPSDDPQSKKSYDLIPEEIKKEIKYFKLPGKLFSINKDKVNQRQLASVIKELA